MLIDQDRVLQKLAFIKEQVDDISELISNSNFSEIVNNKLLVKGIKYSLQTTVGYGIVDDLVVFLALPA